MENGHTNDWRISAFNAELQSKGYRRDFILVANNPWHSEFKGNLYDCLTKYMNEYGTSHGQENAFRLYTYAYYNDDKDYIHCRFNVSIDDGFGFLINNMKIEDGRSAKSIEHSFHNNTEVPEKKQLRALFPKHGFFQRIFRKGRSI